MTDLEIIANVDAKYLPGIYNGRLIPHGPFLEEWKEIANTGGLYLISNYGRAMSLPRVKVTGLSVYTTKGSFLKTYKPTTRYCRIAIFFEGARAGKLVPVHKLVGEYFIPNPHNKPQINHIRGLKQDNVFNQLEWATGKENMQHSVYVLKRKSVKGQPRMHLRKVIESVNIDTGEKTRYKGLIEAEKLGFNLSTISLCIHGKLKTHKNHTWTMIENSCPKHPPRRKKRN